ncbi:MAG: transglutaminase family protein [Chitinophagales bacterium]|nr:transglutaminase family protein [Chitinophagales bacterium]
MQMEQYLRPTKLVDSDHPEVVAFAKAAVGDSTEPVEMAVKLYYAIRDRFPYNPFHVDLSDEGLKASTLVKKGYGYCVEKANLLGAAARAVGIPSRFGFADVINHVGTGRLREVLRSDVFAFHGYTELFLNGRWVKATPAFNKELCEKLGVKPLEFNGEEDSIFQENDGPTGKFMEYLYDHGTFDDIPQQYMYETLKKHYPHLFESDSRIMQADLAKI